MDWLQFAVQWLHVFGGVFWFGSVLYVDFILIPGLQTLAPGKAREAGAAVGARAEKVILPVASLTIVLGVIRGTVFGPIKNLDDLGTTYGITWLVALVAAIATLYWGLRVIVPAVDKLNAVPDSEATHADGTMSPRLAAIIDDIKRKVGLELIGFFIIFTCMILMRFGL
jgi:uncharacterized membrane protein